MKRKIIACLLSFSMLCSTFPTLALATSPKEEPTGTLSVICSVCEVENCTEHIPCSTCGEYNCNVDHSVMPASDPETCPDCGNAECSCDKEIGTCESNHTNWCETCKKDDCGQTHVFCETCGIYDCDVDHSVMPAGEGEGVVTPGGDVEGDPDTVDLKFDLSGGKSESTYLFTLTGTTRDGQTVELKLAVKGGQTITIQDLPAGEYTITPDNKWNWRENVSVEVTGDLTKENATAAVTITDNGKKQWFNGYAYDKN